MRDYRIGCDAHKRYSQLEVQDDRGHIIRQARVATKLAPSAPSSLSSPKAPLSLWRASATGTGSPMRSRPPAVSPSSPTPLKPR